MDYQWLLDNTPDGISIVRSGETLFINSQMAEILGESIEEIMSRSNFDHIHPDSLELVKSRTESRLRGEQPPNKYEIKIIRGDSAIRYIETNTSVIDWEGSPAILTINRDVTELRAHEAKLEALLGHAAAMSQAETMEEIANITYDTVNQTIGFNRLSIGLVIGDTLVHEYRWGINSDRAFIMPLDGPGITVKVVNEKKSQRIGNVLEFSDYVDGTKDTITRSELAVPAIIEGKVVAVLNIESPIIDTFDDTDQKLLEILAEQVSSAMYRIESQKQQRQLSERFNAFVDSASESFVLFDSDLKLIYVNRIGTERLRAYADEIIGASLRDLTPKRTPDRYESYLEVLETGESQSFDAYYHSSGIAHLRISAYKVGDGLGIIATDLTQLSEEQETSRKLDRELAEERFKTNQLIELNRLKTNFMNTATHEIKTPITSIRGYSEIIQGKMARGEMEEIDGYFEAVIRNIDRLEHLSNDLLDMQRIESGRMTVNKARVPVSMILDLLRIEMTPILDIKEQTLEINMPSTKTIIECDELRILQVLINLVQNSSNYTDYGTTITITVSELEDALKFLVMDTGIGISDIDMPKLFTPFPDIRVTNARHGSGLGLSICKGIVDLHGGTIWAESEGFGMGTTFVFILPR
ncbi:PAS domain S-box protein [Candidatus Bathyarchaeota archaeon]|jgi:PAS domain S-box-containing protein|nr:PAS domain S-box protein [Candidatus Bathyarchaeota archaeon]MBT4423901.1 PAS domain S-box protein [Candidatus Bathyarchaeota archaeon]MBT6605698.1 PAS domain S-box protein [Candidatus Bathyarchaeota archaeon]MBT7187499.1 PAS domain S-box protein [Candidatus Bathyarchaeota archaeon]MBT7345749.1 PAS domain S-box protein [Candidatus Bathyarchaeota archaeon]